MSWKRGAIFSLCLSLAAGSARPDPALPSPAGRADPSGPTFQLRTLDGKVQQGTLKGLEPGWTVVLDGDHSYPASKLLWLRQTGRKLPGPPDTPYVVLANGDRIPVHVVRADAEQLSVRPSKLQPADDWNLPLTQVRGLWFRAPATAQPAEQVQWAWERESRSQDRFLLQNGDVIEGSWKGTEKDAFQIKTKQGLESLSPESLAAVGLNTSLTRWPEPARPYVRLILSDGTRLSLKETKLLRGTALAAVTVQGMKVEIPVRDLVSLELIHDRRVDLSDLKPVEYVHVPYLDARWSYVADGSVAGRRLRLGGQVFDKGLGMHSQSDLIYEVPEGFTAFEALVGLDDQTGRRGSVRVKVLVDGQERYASPELVGEGEPIDIRVPLDGGRRLTLRVEFGRNGDVEDHVNWAEARFVRE